MTMLSKQHDIICTTFSHNSLYWNINHRMTLKALKAGTWSPVTFTFKWNKDSGISIIPQVLRDVGVFCGFEAGVIWPPPSVIRCLQDFQSDTNGEINVRKRRIGRRSERMKDSFWAF